MERACSDFENDEHSLSVPKITHLLNYSTVTDLARLRGLSTSVPLASAV